MTLQRQDLVLDTERIPHYYLCNYRPRSAGADELSRSLINFKNDVPFHVEAWTDCSLLELDRIPIEAGCLVMRVLGSNELEVKSETALDKLGRKISECFQAIYHPGFLRKVRTTGKIKLLNSIERQKELADCYLFEPAGIHPPETITILDDILTTGTTVKEVARAIREIFTKSAIRIFTLAYSDRQAFLNKSLELHGESYAWNAKKWDKVAEDQEHYLSIDTLRSKILNDAF